MGFTPEALLQAVVADTTLPTSSEVEVVAANLLQTKLLKKFRTPSKRQAAKEAALSSFLERSYRSSPDLPPLGLAQAFVHRALSGTITCVGDSTEFSNRDCYRLTNDVIFEGMRCGPGSSLMMGQGSTSAYCKIAHGELTVSSEEAYQEYLCLLAEFSPGWLSAEMQRRYHYGMPLIVPYNCITTVPKTDDIDRVIAVEPTINTILQQGMKHYLEEELRRLGINMSTQPLMNQVLAKKGSFSGSLATLDLSAASDSISWSLLERVFPLEVVELVRLYSSPKSRIENDARPVGDGVPLTMGNAITFPLQTLLFLALAYQACVETASDFNINRTVAVFGDDIIIPTSAYTRLTELLTGCGFSVNMEKSFSTGRFRESCGADWFDGFNVRPVFCEGASTQDLFVLRNLLAAWSLRWMPLGRTLAYIDSILRERGKFLLIPMGAAIDSGVRVFQAPDELPWDVQFQCPIYKGYVMKTAYSRSSRKLARRVHSGFLILGHLCGSLQSMKIMERPRRKWLRARIEEFPHSNWGFVHWSERWLYDVKRVTAGFTQLREELLQPLLDREVGLG